MNKKTLISSLLVTATVGLSANVSAAPGGLGDTWYESRIKQTLPKVIDKKDAEKPSTWVTVKNFKVDTGKKACYSHLIVNTATVPSVPPATDPRDDLWANDYLGEVYCAIGGAWKHQSTFAVYDMTNGNVGEDFVQLALPASGSDLSGLEYHRVSFYGTLLLQPKFSSSTGVLKSVTISSKQGLTDYHENVTLAGGERIEGQDKSNLTFKWVKNPDSVPNVNDLLACATSWETGNNPKEGCNKPPVVNPN